MRTLAIGDIHGCSASLDHLLNFIELKPSDLLITLGDYVDRGPDSKGVLDRLIQLHLTGQLIPLRGNHEIMMLAARESRDNVMFWFSCGGIETLESYPPAGYSPTIEDIPETHWYFIRNSCIDWYESENHFFVHANVHPGLPLREQTTEFLHWGFLHPAKHFPHCSGKVMVCGHSEQREGVPLNLGTAIGIDTRAYAIGWLTCLDVTTGEYYQANELGHTRRGQL